jgi:large subunit ribosomal protein L25
MNTKFTLNVASRAHTGRSSSRRLRKVKRVPAILYGKHATPELLSVENTELIKLLKAVAGRATLIELIREKGQTGLAFLQEIQRDPITDNYLHVDLHEVKSDEKFEIRVPVRVTGESNGVKNQNGVLELATHALRIRCLPKDLPEFILVDVTPLNVGEAIKVGDLKAVAGVEFRDPKGQPVVSCSEVAEEVVVEPTTTAGAAEGAAAAAEGAAAATAEGAAGAAPAAGAAAAGDKKGAAAAAGDKKAAAPAAGDKKAAAPAADKKAGDKKAGKK